MKEKKTISKYAALLAMICLTIWVTVGSANAALLASVTEKKPYQYDFFADSSLRYNGFTGAKKLTITFDKDINTATAAYDGRVRAYQKQGDTYVEMPVIDRVVPSGRNFTVMFKNLEFIDASKGMDFELRVDKETFYFDQTSEYVFPFKIYDLLPGFNAVFANKNNMKLINENIFRHNAPRDVMLYLPKLYINKIETIHRTNGIIPGKDSSHLTNIDILADEEAARLKVDFNGDAQHNRDLDRRPDIKGFSMGQAGIDAAVCSSKPGDGAADCNRVVDDFTLTAFDSDGRRLAERTFKIKINPPKGGTPSKTDILKNDYLKAPDRAFGQVKTLYEMTADPKLSQTVFEQLPVLEYDRIGVTYSLGHTVRVANEEQLRMALDHTKFSAIDLGGNTIRLNSELGIVKDLSLTNGTLIGDVQLGDGAANHSFRLKDLTIAGSLEINAGSEGSVILDSSSATSTVIISGGVNSIHLNDYQSSNGMVMKNISPVRLVNTYTDRNQFGRLLDMTIDTDQEIIVEGLLDELRLNVTDGPNRHITVRDGIGRVSRHQDSIGSLNITHGTQVAVPVPLPDEWTVGNVGDHEEGMTQVVKNAEPMEDFIFRWSTGQTLDMNKFDFPAVLEFIVEPESERAFGMNTLVTYSNNQLRIAGLPDVLEDFMTREVRLTAVHGDTRYVVKVQVTVLPE